MQLMYTDAASTLNNFGSGLGSLPGTSVKEMFASFSSTGNAVRVQEICRVVGASVQDLPIHT
jgi:hypothetical protein